MKDIALALANQHSDPAQRLNTLREYLQACILRSLHDSEAFNAIAFVGGTALRFLYQLPRFSEDLDFSVETPHDYAPEQWLKRIKTELGLMGFQASISWNERNTVQVAWVKIADLLKDAELSALSAQKLSIKLEFDTRPPPGADTITEIINRHFLFTLRHHDLPSLMAGKVHALCARSYPKGRDWYDLLWYRSQRPPVQPKLALLQAALDQTEGIGTLNAAHWGDYALQRLNSFDPAKLVADVRPFLERPQELSTITLDNLRTVLPSTNPDTPRRPN